MTLDAIQYQQQIIDEVGDTSSGVLAANMERYWEMGAREPTMFLQFLNAKKRSIRVVLAAERRVDVDSQGLGGVSVRLHQRIDTLLSMLKEVEMEYEVAITNVSSDFGGAVDQITIQAPITAPVGTPDSNDPAYRGDPYRRSR
jgi:hypothetical protein